MSIFKKELSRKEKFASEEIRNRELIEVHAAVSMTL